MWLWVHARSTPRVQHARCTTDCQRGQSAGLTSKMVDHAEPQQGTASPTIAGPTTGRRGRAYKVVYCIRCILYTLYRTNSYAASVRTCDRIALSRLRQSACACGSSVMPVYTHVIQHRHRAPHRASKQAGRSVICTGRRPCICEERHASVLSSAVIIRVVVCNQLP